MNYVALLRGINLGKRRIKMDLLRSFFVALDFTDVETFIASGNVLFASPIRSAPKLEQMIERHLKKELGYDVDTFLRTRAEVAAVAASRPFGAAHDDETTTINVCFCKEPPSAADARRLEAIRTDVDEFKVIGREFYWLCRIKMSESKVWELPQMKTVSLPNATMRNQRTVQKLAALSPAK